MISYGIIIIIIIRLNYITVRLYRRVSTADKRGKNSRFEISERQLHGRYCNNGQQQYHRMIILLSLLIIIIQRMWQAVLIDGAAACRRTVMTETDRKVDGGSVLPTYPAIIRLKT